MRSSHRVKGAYLVHTGAEARAYFVEAEYRIQFPDPLVRAAMLVINSIASPRVLAQMPELRGCKNALYAAVHKLTVGGGRVGEAGRPRALSIRQEELFSAWIESEIAAKRPPTTGLCLRKATELRRRGVQRDDKVNVLDIKDVQIGWLKRFLERHPTYAIKPTRQLEAVRFLCSHAFGKRTHTVTYRNASTLNQTKLGNG